eukprot:XP_001689877.1 predicted protein [Chlamydomonas reinhardtii]
MTYGNASSGGGNGTLAAASSNSTSAAAVNATSSSTNSTSAAGGSGGGGGGGNSGGSPPPAPPAAVGLLRRDAMILEGWNGDGTEKTFTLAAHYKSLRVCTAARLLPLPPTNAPRAINSTNATSSSTSTSTSTGTANLFSARYVLDPGVTCYKYTVWCQGNRELYDLAADPYELSNRIQSAPVRAVNRLDAVLSALVHCSGASCRNPYSLLHPGGGVWDFAGVSKWLRAAGWVKH